MNDMAVMTQALLAQMMPGTQGLRGLPGLLPGEENGGGDPFMQLILQLLSNNTNRETDVMAMLEQVEQMRQDEEEDGVKTAAEMMAEMLFATLPLQFAEPASVQDAPDRTVFPKDMAAPEMIPRDGIERLEGPEAKAQKPTADNVISFEQILTKQSDEANAEVNAAAKPVLPPMEAIQYQSTVQDVRETLRTQPQSKIQAPAKEIDVEALQADVDMKRFLPQTAVASSSKLPETVPTQEVVEQLRTGILENLKADKSEFVVKLKPEGLGEITVKLVETEGKILLNIVTSSPQVAKALNQEVAALQNSLRPLQAQVQEITVAQEILGGTQYGAADHRFENRQQFAGQQNRNRSQGNFSPGGGIDLVSAVAGARMTYDTGLDAYI